MQNFRKREKKNYVNNDEFLQKIKKFKSDYKKGLVHKIPEDIAEIILNIAINLAKCPKFNGYTFKDDMISDAVLNCVEKIHNFSPRKSSNPFAYFTQIIYYAFLRRIKGENKHSFIKNKSLQNFYHILHLEHKGIRIKDSTSKFESDKDWGKLEEDYNKFNRKRKNRS